MAMAEWKTIPRLDAEDSTPCRVRALLLKVGLGVVVVVAVVVVLVVVMVVLMGEGVVVVVMEERVVVIMMHISFADHCKL